MAHLRWKSGGASAPPRLLSKPSEPAQITPNESSSDETGSELTNGQDVEPSGGAIPAAPSEATDVAPIRLTGNTTTAGDPFDSASNDTADDDLLPDETEVDGAQTAELNNLAVDDAADELVASEADNTAVDDVSDMPTIDADLSNESMGDASLAQDDDTELSDGPLMIDPESDDDLPRFAQRTMDQAPSGEPLPAEIQDEEFPPRQPEPGDESLDGEAQPERCPSPRDLKPINQITHRIAAEPGLFPQECVLSDEPFQPRNFSCTVFTWKASALCHKPLYFQQAKLERYGHTFGPVLTPVLSTGHFFVSVLALPYKIGMNPPWECMYPLGWYRPGSCAPYTLGPVPISLRGAALQGVVTTGLWFLFP